MDVRLREERGDDAAAVCRVVGAAFGADDPDHGRVVVELVDLLRRSGHARAGLVAEVDGVVVGHVLLSRSWVDAREGLVEVLVLSPLSVHPEHQGRGIGTRLVAAAIATAETLGSPAVFLEGSPAYYGPRGFRPATAQGFGRPSVRVPEPGFQVALLPAHEPWMTGALAYCDPFWSLDCVGLRGERLEQVERMFDR